MDTSDESDKDWSLPLRLFKAMKDEKKEKDKTVTVQVDKNKLPALLAEFSVANRVSIRLELKMLASFLGISGADIYDFVLSKSTIHRQRTQTIKAKSKQMKENFECPDHVVVHWDGKIIQVLSGLTEDRVAVVFSSTNGITGKFLASPVIPSGTGHDQATAVHQVCQQWMLTNGKTIKGLCFDTTASNSGHKSGAAVLLERMIGYALFHLACRRHIAELHIGHANEDCRGSVDGRFSNLSGTVDLLSLITQYT